MKHGKTFVVFSDPILEMIFLTQFYPPFFYIKPSMILDLNATQ